MGKESIRKKIKELKKKSETILANKEMASETRAFIKSMLAVIDIIVSVLLEKKVRKNSGNSGIPPSKNPGSNGNRNKKEGKGNTPEGSPLPNVRIEKTKEVHSPEKCSNCDSCLKDAPAISTEERKKIDIIYVVEEDTQIAETKKCSNCGEETKADFPEGFDGKIQYGNGIKASAIDLLMAQMMSMQRVQEHFKGLTGRTLSPATMLKYIKQFGCSLNPWFEKTKKILLNAPVLYVDETSVRVNKKNYWLHSYSYGDHTLQFVHAKRGLAAMESIGILSEYKGIVVHDGMAAYFSFNNFKHGLCNAHLLRELRFVEESTESKLEDKSEGRPERKWSTRMKTFLSLLIKKVNAREEKSLTKKEYDMAEKIYLRILEKGKEQLPDFPKANGKKGRLKHTVAQNLWLRLKKYREAVLLFAKVEEVEPTNNRAERDLRMNKVKNKVSGCFRNAEYAKYFCRIYSYLKSMRYQGVSSLQAIMNSLEEGIPPPQPAG